MALARWRRSLSVSLRIACSCSNTSWACSSPRHGVDRDQRLGMRHGREDGGEGWSDGWVQAAGERFADAVDRGWELDRFGQFIALSSWDVEELVGFVVAGEELVLRVPLERPTEPVGDVTKVT